MRGRLNPTNQGRALATIFALLALWLAATPLSATANAPPTMPGMDPRPAALPPNLPPKESTEKVDPVKLERDLIGGWKLVDAKMRTLDGRTFANPTYGANPHGYLLYDASHVMCVFLAVGPDPGTTPPQFAYMRQSQPSTYCGRWSVEPSGHAVIHDIEVSPGGPIGGKQRRVAELHGDTLVIRSQRPQGLEDYFLQFERVK